MTNAEAAGGNLRQELFIAAWGKWKLLSEISPLGNSG